MKTFFNILQTILGKKNKTYPDEPFTDLSHALEPFQWQPEAPHIELMIHNIYYQIKNNDFTESTDKIHCKFSALSSLLNNSFLSKELKEKIQDICCKAQQCYHAFSRLAHIYKAKYYTLLVKNDLSLNPLDPNHPNTFVLVENTSTYLFSLNDLVSIVETAIGNAPEFFVEPVWPLNPYNNQRFTKATLYNIYFKMKQSSRLISVLFHFFFLEHFKLDTFGEHYEPYIRENAIKQFVSNSHHTTLHSEVLEMLKSNRYTKLLYIHKDFPKDQLVDIFRPFLYYYYISHYDIKGTTKVYNYHHILKLKLKKFYEFNKQFGRKYVELVTNIQKRIVKKEIKFNCKCIPFHKILVNIEEQEEYTQENSLYNYGTVIFNFSSPATQLNNAVEYGDADEENDEDDEDVDTIPEESDSVS